MQRKGFTLIELLVVIAIIAILAAILFPVFMSAKAKAQATACLSNTKQIGNGLSMYVQDNNWCLPSNGRGSYNAMKLDKFPDIYKLWFSYEMMKYVKNIGVWKCPAGSKIYTPYTGKGMYYGMALNYWAFPISIFRSTTKTPLIADCIYNGFVSDEEQEKWPTFWDANYLPSRVHNNGANYVFVDGHAKYSTERITYIDTGVAIPGGRGTVSEYRLGK